MSLCPRCLTGRMFRDWGDTLTCLSCGHEPSVTPMDIPEKLRMREPEVNGKRKKWERE